ncbi:Multidrug resistance-associated protein 1 [Podila minutissima]|nr:Multidrug resistance-associated protein 1 [Podila minutissima]
MTFMCTVKAALYASKALHENLLAKVLRLPMSFFDTTPQGRVRNRFSNDITGMDEHIPGALLSFMACLFNLVGSLLILCFVTLAFLLAIPILAVFYLLLLYLLLVRSTLYQHFTETLNGVFSIHAMQLSAQFTARMTATPTPPRTQTMRGMLSSSMYGLALRNMTQITSYAIFSMRQYCDL